MLKVFEKEDLSFFQVKYSGSEWKQSLMWTLYMLSHMSENTVHALLESCAHIMHTIPQTVMLPHGLSQVDIPLPLHL